MGLFGGINKKKLSEVYPECVKLYQKGKLEKAEKLLNPFTGKQKNADYLLGLIRLELGKKHRDKERLESARQLLRFAASCGHQGAAELVAREYGDTRYLQPAAPVETAPAKPAEEPVKAVAPVEPAEPAEAVMPAEPPVQQEPDASEEPDDSAHPDADAIFDEACELFEDEMYDFAFDLMLQAADMGVPEAAFNLAIMYCNGEGTEPDLEEAHKWAAIAAGQEVEGADELLDAVQRLINGDDEPEPEAEEAASPTPRHLTPPATEEEMYRRQLYEYYCPADDFDAALHAHRMGDIRKAKALMAQLAASGNVIAADYAAVCGDAAAFRRWLSNACIRSDQKNITTALALDYLYGAPALRDVDQAGLFAHDAEERGDTRASVLRLLIATFAQDELRNGIRAFNVRDYANAYQHFLKASGRCCDEADYYRALMYRDGLGLQKNLLEYSRLIKGAADNHCDLAVTELSRAFISGHGQPVNYHRARYWASRTLDSELKTLIDDMEDALDLFRQGEYDNALELFGSGVDEGCMDAAFYAGAIHRDRLSKDSEYCLASTAFGMLKVDHGLSFGSFTDKNRQNPRPLTWQIIQIDPEDHSLLLLCDFILDYRCFDSSDQPWTSCDLRSWLNGEALQRFFTPWEQEQIILKRSTCAGVYTDDKLWIPAVPFMKEQLNESGMLRPKYRWSACSIDAPDRIGRESFWLLAYEGRSTGTYYSDTLFLPDEPVSKKSKLGVRPMIWVKC